jgi:putative ATP-binding cassette transporter
MSTTAAQSTSQSFTEAAVRNITIKNDHVETCMRFDTLSLQLENGTVLFKNFSIALKPGDRMVITGPLGCGKSSILRAALGKWPTGSGHIDTVDQKRIVCLTQNTYFPLTSLKGIATYNRHAHEFSDALVADALARVGMGDLAADMNDKTKDGVYWSRLSGGQRQSIAFARPLLLNPDILLLDEATAAMDGSAQEKFYDMITKALPKAIIISISHRPEVMKFHTIHAQFVEKTIVVTSLETARYKPDDLGAGPV